MKKLIIEPPRVELLIKKYIEAIDENTRTESLHFLIDEIINLYPRLPIEAIRNTITESEPRCCFRGAGGSHLEDKQNLLKNMLTSLIDKLSNYEQH